MKAEMVDRLLLEGLLQSSQSLQSTASSLLWVVVAAVVLIVFMAIAGAALAWLYSRRVRADLASALKPMARDVAVLLERTEKTSGQVFAVASDSGRALERAGSSATLALDLNGQLGQLREHVDQQHSETLVLLRQLLRAPRRPVPRG